MNIWNILVCALVGVIHGAMLDNVDLVLTSSPLTATDGELFTLICSVSSGTVINRAWLQNNTTKVITQLTPTNCTKQPPPVGNNINRVSVSCNDTVHSIEFRFNSTTDQGGWQCGKLVNNTYIYPRSNVHSVGVASPVTSTLSSSTSTRYTETTSEPGEMTSRAVSADGGDTDTLYIMIGVVGGAVFLAVVVAGIVCMRRRRQAALSDSSAPVTKPEKTQQDDPMSEDVNTQNTYESLTSVEMHIYRGLK